MASLADDELLRLAIGNLECFALVGVSEAMPRVAAGIEKVFGLTLDTTLPRRNVTVGRPNSFDIPMATRRKIARRVELDIHLYHHVLSRYVL